MDNYSFKLFCNSSKKIESDDSTGSSNNIGDDKEQKNSNNRRKIFNFFLIHRVDNYFQQIITVVVENFRWPKNIVRLIETFSSFVLHQSLPQKYGPIIVIFGLKEDTFMKLLLWIKRTSFGKENILPWMDRVGG